MRNKITTLLLVLLFAISFAGSAIAAGCPVETCKHCVSQEVDCCKQCCCKKCKDCVDCKSCCKADKKADKAKKDCCKKGQ